MIGISTKHLERIFTIFKRLHTYEEYEGTGIGLAIAQKIVDQQGGEIWAESELEKGTTFSLQYPCDAVNIFLDVFFHRFCFVHHRIVEIYL